MPLGHRLAGLWRNLFRKDRVEQELSEEIQAHLDLLIESKIREGLDPEESRRAALIEMGGLEQVKESVREVRMGRHLETLWWDLYYCVQTLRKKPVFSLVIVITLALGIGANTAIFSVVNATLLSPLPFKDQDRLVMLWSQNRQRNIERGEFTSEYYLDLRERNQVFDEIACYGPWGFNITGEDEAEKITAVVVSLSLFQTLGVDAIHGRTFLPEESTAGRNNVVLLSHGLWQRRYGGDKGLVGRSLKLDGRSYAVVGIMPPDFRFPNGEVEMWAPLDLTPAPDGSSRNSRWLNLIARLKTGETIAQAQTEMATIAAQLEQQHADTNSGWGVGLAPLHELVVKDVRLAVLLLFGAVGLVLLIACGNVANLMLSRVESRQKEMAIRAALGAGRGRLVRLLLTETMLLSLIGGALGLVLAVEGLGLLSAFIPRGPVPGPDDLSLLRLNEIHLDGRVFGFAFLLSLMAGILFGLVPALQASRIGFNDILKEGGRTHGSRSGSRLRYGLVVSEVALTLILLTGAGLLVRSFTQLMGENPGFKPENVITFRISPASKYRLPNERLAFYQQLIERINSLPDVQAMGGTTTLPFSGTELNTPFSIKGRDPALTEPTTEERPRAMFHSITPDYLRAMGIPLVRGRQFTAQDDQESPGVVLINETMARRYWPGHDPIGQRLEIGYSRKELEIIGMVGDVRQLRLDAEVKPEVYVSFNQTPWTFMTFVIKTAGDPSSLASTVRGQVGIVDKDIPVYSIATMQQRMSDSVAKRRFNMLLVGSFGFLALVLAGVGIYGVISYSVAQRTHEIGLRMALGADRRDIFRLIVGQGIVLTIIGIGIGLIGSFALTRLISTLLFGVTATDTLTFAGVSLLLSSVALAACYVPARRATRVDPMVALRYE